MTTYTTATLSHAQAITDLNDALNQLAKAQEQYSQDTSTIAMYRQDARDRELIIRTYRADLNTLKDQLGSTVAYWKEQLCNEQAGRAKVERNLAD